MSEVRPSGTVTFLFTDLDDSARRWDDAGTDLAAALQVHDAIVRDAIDSNGGYVFSTGEDSFSAAFSTAADAAAAAIKAQQLLAQAVVPLPVRMGLHTGAVIERDGNYVGSDVNRAGRLMSLAHGGQILVSEATQVLLDGRVQLRPLGEHRLRGLRGRMTVYQVVADGLRTEFPVLRAADRLAGNVPQQLSSFVGREDLLQDVAESVRDKALVTFSGPGGVGKTRLALELGAELAAEFPDGVWVVELAPVDSLAVVPAIATVLGLTPQGDLALIDTVAEALAGQRLLLVMDNCEHVLISAAAAIDVILQRSGNVKILATSREPLGVVGETVVPVSPLGREGGASSDAVTLFLDRARVVRPQFGLEDADAAAAVVEICDVLDGLPLGIELAAARMAAMSPRDVRDRLADRFRLLKGSESSPDRQHTLHQVVGWSYDLLTDDERDVLGTSSVFAGGFDLAALFAIVEDADEVEVLGHLDSLVRKSLVFADHTASRTRYGMFETIRQYAEDRLAERGALEQMRDRHAAHFAHEASIRWETWDGPGWREAVDWVDVELGNLRSGFRWSSRRGDFDVATDIAAHAALMGFSVQLFETLSWAEELLDDASQADVRRLPRLYTAAGYACFVGRAETARAHAHRASELEVDPRYNPCQPGYATFIEALCEVYCGNLERYVELTGEVAERYGKDRGYGIASYVDGLQSSGRVKEALALAEDGVAAARDLGNPYWIAYALWIAGLAFSKADAQRALAAWDEGVAFVREHRVQFFEGFLARDAARLHTSDGEPEAALALFSHAINAFHRAGNVPQLVITLASLPALLELVDRPEPAATLLAAILREQSSTHHVPGLGELDKRLNRRLGTKRAQEVALVGVAMDLNEAATYALQQIDRARRSPITRQVRPGGLSRREIEVLRLVADGRTAREIATQLFISARTAEHHIQHVYTKIGVTGRAAATRWAVAHEVVDVNG